MKPGVLLAFAFMVAVSLAHVVRFLFRVPVTVGGWTVPIWPSALAVLLFAAVAGLIWRETHPRAGRTR